MASFFFIFWGKNIALFEIMEYPLVTNYFVKLDFFTRICFFILIHWQVTFHTTSLLVPILIGGQRLVITYIIW